MPARGCHKKEANKFENLNSVRCVVGLERAGYDIMYWYNSSLSPWKLELGK